MHISFNYRNLIQHLSLQERQEFQKNESCLMFGKSGGGNEDGESRFGDEHIEIKKHSNHRK